MTTPQIISKVLATLSALSAASGTYLMWKYSLSLGQFSAYWNAKLIDEVKAQNAKRLKYQKIALALLIAGIALACASALV
jgi:hypothetical protein